MNFIVEFLRACLNKMLQLFSLGRSISNTLKIYIKTNTGRTLSVNLEPQWDIKNVKEIVAPQLGLQPNEVKIIFAGKELSDATTIEECDLGQLSILHAIKAMPQRERERQRLHSTLLEEDVAVQTDESVRLLNDSMTCIQQLEQPERQHEDSGQQKEAIDLDKFINERARKKSQFFVYCPECQKLCRGKLRVRCSICRGGAFTVYTDPENWDDVLKSKRIHGCCENLATPCVNTETGEPPFAEFYFKCAEHASGNEQDFATPLNLIKHNINEVPCLACTDVWYIFMFIAITNLYINFLFFFI